MNNLTNFLHSRLSAGLLRLGTLLLATAILGACGFQLRGSSSLPFNTLWIGTAENNQLGNSLKRYVRAGTSTQIAASAKEAEALFDLISEAREKEIVSLNSVGRVREYVLRYCVSFRVHDGRGRDFIPPGEIVLKREIAFNESAILANESEEALLYRDMQNDVVQQILRRLAAVRRV